MHNSNLSWRQACVTFLLCATTAIALPGQALITLHSFDATDGQYPEAPLVQATDGNLYGTTPGGGANSAGGTIFKITPGGRFTTLYSFCSRSGCADGKYPEVGLIQATDGSLYGTTDAGGANDSGTVFKITLSGSLTTLYNFCSQSGCADGQYPEAGLIQATDGNFYGTTVAGGANGAGGTVFKITPGGSLTTLYSFCSQSGCTDGEYPEAGLVQASNGNLYGTTDAGGANDSGTVFEISPGGVLKTLYSFCTQSGCGDGQYPQAGLIQATSGNLYGTTYGGGANGGGTVFKISPSGHRATLYSFCSQSGCADGEYPKAGLIQATDGNLYGTTHTAGAYGGGTVFKISPGGTLTTVYSFCSQSGCTDGDYPRAALTQDTNGKLYGAAAGGGANGYGAIFGLSAGLLPFVETQTTYGKVGTVVTILGTDLTGATSVTFNGTPAAFTVESSSYIKTTVPAGATTGTVQVVTPSGTLSGNLPFRVAPRASVVRCPKGNTVDSRRC